MCHDELALNGKKEANRLRERRYYMRVIARTTTRCWGLVFVVGSFVPALFLIARLSAQVVPPPQAQGPAQQAPSAAPAPVAPPPPVSSAVPAVPPAPPPPTATVLWSVELSTTAAVDLAATAARVFAITRGDEGPSRLAAYDATSGQEVWASTETGWQQIVTSDSEVIGARGSRVVALDEATGRQLWQVEAGFAPTGLTVAGGWLVITGPSGVIAATREGGSIVWRRDDIAMTARAAVAGSILVVGADDRTLSGLDLTTGAAKWQAKLEGTARFIGTGALVVYATTSDGQLCAFRSETGRYMFCFRFGVPAAGPPVFDGEFVYAGLLDNTVRALDRESGAQARPVELGQRPVTSPILVGSSVVVPLSDAQVVRVANRGRGEKIVTPNQPARVRVVRAAPTADAKSLALLTSVPQGTLRLTVIDLPPPPPDPKAAKPAPGVAPESEKGRQPDAIAR
jgi:outer membrane protein assembly factor BamB